MCAWRASSLLFFFKISKRPLVLPLEGNDRLSSSLSSSSKGRVRENFLINQQMSTFTLEIRIESAESASVPCVPVDCTARPGRLHRFFITHIFMK
jgi:hypothetical protein